MKKILYITVLLCSILSYENSFAQQITVVDYKEANKELSEMEKKLISGKVTIDDTVGYIKSLSKIQTGVSDLKKQDEQDLMVVQKRIEALGEAPKDGEKESKEISKKRTEFANEVSTLRAKIAEGDLIITKIGEIENLVLSIRNKDLFGNILNKQDMFTHPDEILRSSIDLIGFSYGIFKSPVTWYDNLTEKEKADVKENILYVILIMSFALCIGIYLSYFIRSRLGYKANTENLDYSKKVFAAAWTFIAYGVIPAAMIGGFLLWLNSTPVMDNVFFSLVLKNTAVYLLYIFLSLAVIKVVFVPNNSKWRLFEVCDEKAIALSKVLRLSIIAICFVSWFESIASSNATSEVVFLVKMMSNVVKMLSIVMIAKTALYNTKALTDDEIVKGENDGEDLGELSLSSKLSIIISFSAVGIFCLSLFGYVSLSEYIFNKFIQSLLVLGLFYILNKMIKGVIHRVLSLRFWIRNLRIGRRTLIKADFWFGFFLTPVLLVLTILCLLGLWGVSVDILLQNIKRFLTGFYVGGVRISILSIFIGIAVFFVSWAIFKALKRSVQTGALANIDMDDGVRGSLSAGLSFVGFIVSVILAIAAMGGNLTNLALIAGALSFGIGLGLQNIVSNFVSGIIILFERPMKIGDWVIINGQEGIVKQINIRGTEIETFDKSTVIIPNATILSSSLTNFTHRSKIGRVKVDVTVPYDSDTKLIKNILFDLAKNHKKVLPTPAPSVSLAGFGDNGMNYELRCFTGNVNNRGSIQNDIREDIIAKFREENIEIPLSQQVVHDGNKKPVVFKTRIDNEKIGEEHEKEFDIDNDDNNNLDTDTNTDDNSDE